MTDFAARIYDIRCYAESCSTELGVPLEAIVEHVASLGGADLYCQDGDFIGPVELREAIVRFCKQYKFDRLPAEEQQRQRDLEKRGNTWHYSDLKRRLEPFLKADGYMLYEFDTVICRALEIINPFYARQLRLSEDAALDKVLIYMKGRRGTMPKDKYNARNKAIGQYLMAWWQTLGITDPFKQLDHTKKAFGKTMQEAVNSDEELDDLKKRSDVYFGKVKEAQDELAAAGLAKKTEPPAEPDAPQPGLFDDLNAIGETLQALPEGAVVTVAATATKESVVTLKEPETPPAAPPVDETPSAGDAIPDVTGQPLPAPVTQEAGQSETAEPEKEVTAIGFTLDYIVNDTLSYTLTAAYNKETGDVWTATAVVRGHEPDGEDIMLIKKDVETNLRARKPADVVLDIEYEPTVEEINAVKNKCYDLATKTYPDLTKEQRLEKIKSAWSDRVAKDAIAVWGLRGAYDKVHEAFAQIEDTKPSDAEQAATNLFPSMVSDVVDETPKSLAVAEKQQAIQQAPVGNQNLGFRMPNPEQWAFIVSYADFAVRSGFYPGVKDKNQAIVVMIQGFTLGVDPVSSLRGIDPIPSKRGIQLCFRAKLAKALVMRTGYCEEFVVVGDDKKATATVKRKGHPKNVFTFTYADAETAGLIKRNPDVWGSYTAKMLKNRVITEAVSVEFPEVYFAFSAAMDDDDEDEVAA